MSETEFNDLTGFAVVCPITNQAKDYVFEVLLPEGLPFTGVILTDQLKSLDVRKRKIKVVGSNSNDSEVMKVFLRNNRSIFA